MGKWLSTVGLVMAAILALVSPAWADRIALVIGNAQYEKAPTLRNPANDAQDMAAQLKTLGFTLVGDGAHLNVDRTAMARLVRDFGNQAHEGDTALFYYAGHGIAFNGDNWLLPVNDRDIQVQEDVPDFALSSRSVIDRMQQRGGGTNILILDACRNNPLPDRKRSLGGSRGLQRLNVPNGSFVMYSASEGQAAMDGEGRNGVFTGVLLKLMSQPGLRLEDIYYETLKQVTQLSKDQQEPMAELKLTEAFYFVPAASATGISDPSKLELTFWTSSACASGNLDGCRMYLKNYPNGQFAALGMLALSQKTPTEPIHQPPPVADQVNCMIPNGITTKISKKSCREQSGVILP